MNRLIFFLRFLLLTLALLLAYVKPAAAAPSCSIYFNAQMYFGTISLLDGGTKTTSADMVYQCSGTPGEQVLLCISAGPTAGGSYDPRYLALTNSTTSTMAFNLYTSSSYSTVLGSVDSGGSYPPVAIIFTIPPSYYGSATLPIFGKISTLGQEGLPEGTYNTNSINNWPFKLSYRVYQQGEPVSCNTSFSNTATSRLYIEAVVAKECRINAASTMDFGDAPSVLTTNLDSTSTLNITCNNVSYRVDLNNGQHYGSSTRRMSGTAGYVRYELYRDSSRNNRWGTNHNGVNQTGTGTPQQLTVYGRVPPQTMPGDGSYSDVITVSVVY